MADRSNPPARPSPPGRLPTRSFRKSGTVQNPAPLPKANTPAPSAGSRPTLPSFSKPGAVALIEHDIACGILAGVFDTGSYSVTMETITQVDAATRAQTVQKDWLRPNDIVGALTRMFLAARQALSEMPAQAGVLAAQRTQQMKARDEAAARHQELKRQIYDVLRFRDVLERAEKSGFRLIYSPPEPQTGVKRAAK